MREPEEQPPAKKKRTYLQKATYLLNPEKDDISRYVRKPFMRNKKREKSSNWNE